MSQTTVGQVLDALRPIIDPDLGKNIVKTMLQAAGLTVHDLGCDVQVRSYVDKAEELDADVIAASAILTTTMAYMPDLVNLLADMNLRERFKVMVGGAPTSPDFAKKIGATYSADANGKNMYCIAAFWKII